jgi:hypothetical protein
MIKLQRDQLSVYVTLGMFGAGVGLLVGSYLTSLLASRRFNKQLEESSKHEELINHEYETERRRTEGPESDPADIPADAGPASETGTETSTTSRTGRTAPEGGSQTDEGGEGSPAGVDDDEEGDRGDDAELDFEELQERFQFLTRRYRVAKDELSNLAAGLYTVYDLERTLIKEGRELDRGEGGYPMISADDVIDEINPESEFDVLTEDPTLSEEHPAYRTKLIVLAYNTKEDVLYRIRKGRRFNTDELDDKPEAVDICFEMCLTHGYEKVYVWDRTASKAYSFHLELEE